MVKNNNYTPRLCTVLCTSALTHLCIRSVERGSGSLTNDSLKKLPWFMHALHISHLQFSCFKKSSWGSRGGPSLRPPVKALVKEKLHAATEYGELNRLVVAWECSCVLGPLRSLCWHRAKHYTSQSTGWQSLKSKGSWWRAQARKRTRMYHTGPPLRCLPSCSSTRTIHSSKAALQQTIHMRWQFSEESLSSTCTCDGGEEAAA